MSVIRGNILYAEKENGKSQKFIYLLKEEKSIPEWKKKVGSGIREVKNSKYRTDLKNRASNRAQHG